MTKRRYTYTVLRYVHDTVSGEFVNVGVLAFFPASRGDSAILKFRTRHTIGRMRDMFPDLMRTEFLSAMHTVDRSAGRLAKEVAGDTLGLSSETDALAVARRLVVVDDSALQWSSMGGGLTDAPDATFERLYQRHVAKYDEKSLARRSDEEVWKPVRLKLQERHVPVNLEEKTIAGEDDHIHFQHAWKNGVWHAYEPLSLDLADADGIYKKAHRWLGQLTSVVPSASEAFRAHFIVGAPENNDLRPAYERALRILRKAPNNVDVYEETEIDALVDKIEDEVRAHLQP